jgi:hypothetical protein
VHLIAIVHRLTNNSDGLAGAYRTVLDWRIYGDLPPWLLLAANPDVATSHQSQPCNCGFYRCFEYISDDIDAITFGDCRKSSSTPSLVLEQFGLFTILSRVYQSFCRRLYRCRWWTLWALDSHGAEAPSVY